MLEYGSHGGCAASNVPFWGRQLALRADLRAAAPHCPYPSRHHYLLQVEIWLTWRLRRTNSVLLRKAAQSALWAKIKGAAPHCSCLLRLLYLFKIFWHRWGPSGTCTCWNIICRAAAPPQLCPSRHAAQFVLRFEEIPEGCITLAQNLICKIKC